MAKIVGTILVFVIAVLEASAAAAGFCSPESLVRNLYAHYGDRSSDLSSGLPHDSATARQFFDASLQAAWISLKKEPYDFFVPEREMEAWRHLDIDPAQAIRQDLRRRRL